MSAPSADGFRPDPNGPPETRSEAARRVGMAKRVFDGIRLPYPLQTAAVAQMDEVRWAAIGRDPGATCSGAVLVAPNGCGKTEACRTLVRHAAAGLDEQHRQTPVLLVTIDVEGTTGSVPTAILAALKDPRPGLGKETVRWRKAIDRLKAAQVELVLLDEFNRAGRRPTMSAPIALSIREKLLDTGVCPVVVIGSEGAAKVLSNAPALLECLDEQIDLQPLDWEVDGDREIFIDFLGSLDTRLLKEGLMLEHSGLADCTIARKLWEASAGRVRRLMKIVRFAMGDALRVGCGSIELRHLREGVEGYAIRAGLIDYNPFESE